MLPSKAMMLTHCLADCGWADRYLSRLWPLANPCSCSPLRPAHGLKSSLCSKPSTNQEIKPEIVNHRKQNHNKEAMKKLILTAVLGVACVSAFAQGSFLFNNFGGGANAPVFDTDGTTKLGNTFQADLYWGHGTITDSTQLTALGSPVTFSGSGYF